MVLQLNVGEYVIANFYKPDPKGRVFFCLLLAHLSRFCLLLNAKFKLMPKTTIFITLALFSFFIFPTAQSQTSPKTAPKPKTDSAYLYYFYAQSDSAGLYNHLSLDTSMYRFQHYDPIYQKVPFSASLGNIGLAHHNLVFTPKTSTDFDFGVHSFDGYLFTVNQLKYFVPSSPFTELYYEMGSKKEQVFKASHYQQVRRGLTVGADLMIIHSLGYYPNQTSNVTDVNISASYFSKNKKYSIIASYINNRIKATENGGILADSIFEQNLYTDRTAFNVWLNSAQNQYKESGLYFKQYFFLTNKKSRVQDDSTARSKWHIDLGKITHTFQYLRQSQVYRDGDPMSGYYLNIYADSLKTFDTTYMDKYENQFTWTNASNSGKPRFFELFVSIKHDFFNVKEDSIKWNFSQISPSAGISITPYRNMRLNGNAGYTNGTYNGGDYYLNASLLQIVGDKPGKQAFFMVKANIAKTEPAWFYEHYHANNFRWDTSFTKQKTAGIGFDFSYKYLKAGFNYYICRNFVYLDTLALPAQITKNFRIMNMFVSKDTRIGILGFDNKVVFQQIYGTNAIRVPDYIVSSSLYCNLHLFNKAMFAQIGVDGFYNSSYYADAYMPALRSFYQQNTKKIGNYYYLDFFINMQVKRARMFVKYQHFNSWFGDYSYYMTPHYPMQDASLKFGVSWIFHD